MEQVFTPLLMPVLKHCPFVMSVPHWFPILGPIRRLVETTRKHLNDLRDLPIQYVQKNEEADAGLIPPLLHEINEGDPSSTEQARRIKDVGTTVYAAGADTVHASVPAMIVTNGIELGQTSSSTGTFFLAMARNIHSQKKAQQEIDAVVGRGRLPNLDDRDSLPYVEAVYQEVMRWYPPLPLGVPHMATTDDNYRGYYIPQGALVFANIWCVDQVQNIDQTRKLTLLYLRNMTHDEEIYPDPYCFKPERFLNTQRNINDVLAYGFGRRICVGRHLADTELWLTFASVLACFDITNEKDEYGNEIVIPENYSDGPVFFS
uniref:Cytochrome P450 n=1 Tax=Moniliophthora roreri TaxID=221103 RepID=A0A0W0F7L8_MONRR